MNIDEMLRKHEDTLLNIKRRLYFLKAIQQSFDKLTRGKYFTIYNDIIYRMLEDTWDMLVIDLSSLSTDMLGKGGFFKKLKANNHLLSVAKEKDLVAPRGIIMFGEDLPQEEGQPPVLLPTEEERDQISLEIEQGFVKEMIRYNREAFFRLFPNAEARDGHKLKAEDVDDLIVKFDSIVRAIIADRNKHRAHKYERKEIDPSVRKLNFDELESKLGAFEAILSDIRLISNKSSFSFGNMNTADVDCTANDLVMLILTGGLVQLEMRSGMNDAFARDAKQSNHEMKFGRLYREAFVDEMHERHEQFHARFCHDQAKKVNESKSYEVKVNTPDFNNSKIERFEFEQLDGKLVKKKW